MTEQMIKRQISRYTNDVIRYKKLGDRSYAIYKENGDQNEYTMSQVYYKKSNESREICDNYKAMLRDIKI